VRGFVTITNTTTTHSLNLNFNGTVVKTSTPTFDFRSVSGPAGVVSGTGTFRLWAGELDFSIVQGGPLSKGGLLAAPAMELSISGGLHNP
jgi:hypothetical protein